MKIVELTRTENMVEATKMNTIRDSEDGVVALFVTLILIIILSIIVIGFSQVARTEGRNALNQELSTQAFYAAESGVNDAYSVVYNDIMASKTIPSALGPGCLSTNYVSSIPTPSNEIDSSTNTQYTCVLVNPNPPSINATPGVGQPAIEDLNGSTGSPPVPTAINSLTISWRSDLTGTEVPYNIGSCTSVSPNFIPNANWAAACPSIMRVDLVPIPNSANFSEANLESSQRTFFIYPDTAAHASGTQDFNSISDGQIFKASCTSSCSFTVNTLGQDQYYIRMQYIYNNPPYITVCGNGCDASLTFNSTQVQIDVTGESQNVLRRIQVALSLTGASAVTPPGYAIQTNDSLCKSLVADQTPGNQATYEYIPSTDAPSDLIGFGGLSLPTGYKNIDITPASLTDPCNPYF